MEMLVSTHPKQCGSSVASHSIQCARWNTKNDHDIGTQTHAQDCELISHSPNVLFVAFKGTNLCSDILKLYLGAFFLKIMFKSYHNSDSLV